jgi:outer membrane protein
MLLLKTQNNLQAAQAQLSTLLGLRSPTNYQLIEEPMPPPLATNVSNFVQEALSYRPDLLSLRNQWESSIRFARAEKELRYPRVLAVGAAGVVPIHDAALADNFAAAGLVVDVPIFAGGYYSARQRAAELEAQAEASNVRNLEDDVVRDVHVAWLNAKNAFDRYEVNVQLVANAQLSYNLAQASYKAGLTSIVEFNQAELNLISAQISLAGTLYEYLTQRSILTFQTGQLH